MYTSVPLLAIVMYMTVFTGKVYEITKRQFLLWAFPVASILSGLLISFMYFTTSYLPLYKAIIYYIIVGTGTFIVVSEIFFIIFGNKNMRMKYNLDLHGKSPWDVAKFKKSRR